jgi:hypothetical protein
MPCPLSNEGRILWRQALSPSYWYESIQSDIVLDKWQRDVLDSPAKRIVLNCCRQAGKSLTLQIACSHHAFFYPRSLIILTAPSERQALENLLHIVSILESAGIRGKDYPEKSRLSLVLPNASRILALPNSPDQLRGYSKPSLICEDESARCGDDLYSALSPMLSVNPDGKMVLASTPHYSMGHYHNIYTGKDETWHRVLITAKDIPRITEEHLRREQGVLGPLYEQEYSGKFIDVSEYGVFRLQDILSALSDEVPEPVFEGIHL